MSEPLIPYLTLPEIPLSFLKYVPLLGDMFGPDDVPSIKPFGTLVAIGVYVGWGISMRRARERRIDPNVMGDFVVWVVASGFVISHILDALFYHPETVAKDPLYLLKIWDGLSSYGGFLGAVGGAVAFKYYRKQPVLELIDITVSAMPFAWLFGRAGCSVVHDHPGALSNAWYAVKYPAHQLAQGYLGRYDLGLYEWFATIPIAIASYVLWKRQPVRSIGFYIGVILTMYAPPRFFLDFLRLGSETKVLGSDPRYGGLTPAQWACFLALGVGLYLLYRVRTHPNVPDVASRTLPEDEVDEDEDEADAPAEAAPRRKRRRRRPVDGEAPAPRKRKKRRPRAQPEQEEPAAAPAAEAPPAAGDASTDEDSAGEGEARKDGGS